MNKATEKATKAAEELCARISRNWPGKRASYLLEPTELKIFLEAGAEKLRLNEQAKGHFKHTIRFQRKIFIAFTDEEII